MTSAWCRARPGPGRPRWAWPGSSWPTSTWSSCTTATPSPSLITLEDYGFCAKGEGGPFVGQRRPRPGGKLKLNTGGGQLSSYYMWGMTPLSEAIIQARGQAGERQAEQHELVLVSGNGGVLDHHSTLVLAGA